MLLTKIHDGASGAASAARPRFRRIAGARLPTMDRRAFLKRSGLVAGAGAFASQIPFNLIGKADAAADSFAKKVEVKRTVCTHCSVGCSIDATVENGVWTRQEPVFDSPLNLGAHCAKGASVRERRSNMRGSSPSTASCEIVRAAPASGCNVPWNMLSMMNQTAAALPSPVLKSPQPLLYPDDKNTCSSLTIGSAALTP